MACFLLSLFPFPLCLATLSHHLIKSLLLCTHFIILIYSILIVCSLLYSLSLGLFYLLIYSYSGILFRLLCVSFFPRLRHTALFVFYIALLIDWRQSEKMCVSFLLYFNWLTKCFYESLGVFSFSFVSFPVCTGATSSVRVFFTVWINSCIEILEGF